MKKKLRNRTREIKTGLQDRISSFRFPILMLILLLGACSTDDTAHEHDTYTCPMHPTVVSDSPGSCPVCGMDLVRKARPGEEVEISEDLSKLIESPNERVVTSVKTIKGEFRTLAVSVTAPGVITYDTRGIHTIPARVGGRLEKVYIKFAFQPVTKGQKIAEIYSPELITAQRELLFLLQNDPDNHALTGMAKRKLQLLGLSDQQIKDLVRKNETSNSVSIYSPYAGYVVTGQRPSSGAVPMSSPRNGTGAGMGMGARNPGAQSASPSAPDIPAGGSIKREGDYVTAGETLFTVVNSTALRIELDLPGAYSGDVREGSKVELELGNNRKETVTVDLVQPFFSGEENFLKVRVYPENTDGLQIGQLVNGKIHLPTTEALWVPKEALLDLGTQSIVFVKEQDALKPRRVTTGVSADGMIQIRNGLASSEDIAANAQYLVDSEGFIRVQN